jgi:hypothetical protein
MARIIQLNDCLPEVDMHVTVPQRVYVWLLQLQAFTGDTPEAMVASMLDDIMKDDSQAEGLTQRH